MTDMVEYYLNRLETTLGKADFDVVFSELCGDKRMKREDINAVASRFVSRTAKSATRQDSLERIMRRHENILDSKQKDAVLSHHGNA
jgi:hypothetical protein